jgi:hypothetical protein
MDDVASPDNVCRAQTLSNGGAPAVAGAEASGEFGKGWRSHAFSRSPLPKARDGRGHQSFAGPRRAEQSDAGGRAQKDVPSLHFELS